MRKKTINGVEIAFVDRGSGPVLLLVHGFPLDHSMWDAQIEAFAGQYRVVAVDLRGFGQSDAGDDMVEEMRAIADGIANSQFVAIAGSGHMSPMEKPDEFNAAVLEFISATES